MALQPRRRSSSGRGSWRQSRSRDRREERAVGQTANDRAATASSTSTRVSFTGAVVRFVTCSSYPSTPPESLTATVGGLGTRSSIDDGS